jgi:hypothetical protein
VDLPFDVIAMIEVYIDDALRATGTQRGAILHADAELDDPEPVDPDSPAYIIDEPSGGLDYAMLFDEAPPAPLARQRAARGSVPPPAAAVSFDDAITRVIDRPTEPSKI